MFRANVFSRVVVALGVALGAIGISSAPVAAATAGQAYVALTNGDGSAWAFGRIDLTTYQYTAVSASETPEVEALAAQGTHLYSVASFANPSLYAVDKNNGAQTLVGAQRTANDEFTGLTFDATGTLYGVSLFYGGTSGFELMRQLYTFNPTSGAATTVGMAQDGNIQTPTGLAAPCGSGLFALVLGGPTGYQLAAVDETTGEFSSGTALTGLAQNEGIHGIAFRHSTGKLYAATNVGTGFYLATVNTSTGALTKHPVSNLPSGFDRFGAFAIDGPSACHYTRSVSIIYGARAFEGSVSGSAVAWCMDGVKVKVYKQVSGPDTLVGSATTDSSGSYVLVAPDNAGTYYAKAPKKVTAIGSCLAAKSPNLIR
jgi:hypothetical protein